MRDIYNIIWECASSCSEPFYLYDLQRLKFNAMTFLKNFDIVAYPYKSSSIVDIVQFLHSLGIWAEVSSKEEYVISRRYACNVICNFPYFVDVNFTDNSIFVFNSVYDLFNYYKSVNSIGIRIQASHSSKFGISDFNSIVASKFFFKLRNRIKLLHFHIGTNILNLNKYYELISKSCSIIHYLNDLGCDIEYLDIGGGFPTNPSVFNPDQKVDTLEFICSIKNFINKNFSKYSLDLKIVAEPGRAILAPGSYLVAKVVHIKNNFAFLNIGSTHIPSSRYLIHNVTILSKRGEEKTEAETNYCIVGSLCYDDDVIFTSKLLPRLDVGDLVIIHDAGAYSVNMAPEFFILPKPNIFVYNGTNIFRAKEFKDVL